MFYWDVGECFSVGSSKFNLKSLQHQSLLSSVNVVAVRMYMYYSLNVSLLGFPGSLCWREGLK